LQNSNQIATSKKTRQPISFKDENAMNAAIKKQENALLIAQHKANQKKKTLARLNLEYSSIKKDSLLQENLKAQLEQSAFNPPKEYVSSINQGEMMYNIQTRNKKLPPFFKERQQEMIKENLNKRNRVASNRYNNEISIITKKIESYNNQLLNKRNASARFIGI
jgi:hypothetical protein